MKYFFVFLCLCSFLIAEENPVGPVLLVGGGPIPQKAVILMKNKSKNDKFLVITCNIDTIERWKNLFGNVEAILPEQVKDVDLNTIGGIIIGGGDQWQYVNRLDGKIIEKAHKLGIPILGTSAGAMVLGSNYFSAEKGTITSEEAIEDKNVCIGKNFINIPFLQSQIIDVHYTERNRQGRLKVFIKRSESTRGIGIDEETALYIDNEKFEVVGSGGVTFVNSDESEKTILSNDSELLTLYNNRSDIFWSSDDKTRRK